MFGSRQKGTFKRTFYHSIQVGSGTYLAPVYWVLCTHVVYFKNNLSKYVLQLFVNIQLLKVIQKFTHIPYWNYI